MKIIVSKQELEVLQNGVNSIVDEINKIDETANAEKSTLLEMICRLEDNIHARYRLIKGDFEITISEDLINDFSQTYISIVIKSLPIFKALYPVIEMMKPAVIGIKEDLKGFMDRQSLVREDREEEATKGKVGIPMYPNGDSTCHCHGGTNFCENCRPF